MSRRARASQRRAAPRLDLREKRRRASSENCDLYREYLTYAGFRVIDAENGDVAMQRALAIRPDVVVMDLAMPVMDGYQATSMLKANPHTRAVPIVAVTAAGPSQREAAMMAGCDAYIVKPCPLEHLEDVLRVQIAAHRRDEERRTSRG